MADGAGQFPVRELVLQHLEALRRQQGLFQQLNEQERKWKIAVRDRLEDEESQLEKAKQASSTASTVAISMGFLVGVMALCMCFCFMQNQSTIKDKVKEAVSEYEKRQTSNRHKYSATPGAKIEMGGLTARHENLDDELDQNNAWPTGRPTPFGRSSERLDDFDDIEDAPSTSL